MIAFHKLIFCFLFISCIACSSNEKKKHVVYAASISLYNKGMDCMMRGNEDSALVFFDKAIESDSLYYFAYFYKQSCLLQMKRFDEAIKTSKRMVELWPENPSCHSQLAMLLENQGDTIQSMLHYNKAVGIQNEILDTLSRDNKNYASIIFSFAMNNLYAGKDKEAKELFSIAYTAYRDNDTMMANCAKRCMLLSRKDLLKTGRLCD